MAISVDSVEFFLIDGKASGRIKISGLTPNARHLIILSAQNQVATSGSLSMRFESQPFPFFDTADSNGDLDLTLPQEIGSSVGSWYTLNTVVFYNVFIGDGNADELASVSANTSRSVTISAGAVPDEPDNSIILLGSTTTSKKLRIHFEVTGLNANTEYPLFLRFFKDDTYDINKIFTATATLGNHTTDANGSIFGEATFSIPNSADVFSSILANNDLYLAVWRGTPQSGHAVRDMITLNVQSQPALVRNLQLISSSSTEKKFRLHFDVTGLTANTAFPLFLRFFKDSDFDIAKLFTATATLGSFTTDALGHITGDAEFTIPSSADVFASLALDADAYLAIWRGTPESGNAIRDGIVETIGGIPSLTLTVTKGLPANITTISDQTRNQLQGTIAGIEEGVRWQIQPILLIGDATILQQTSHNLVGSLIPKSRYYETSSSRSGTNLHTATQARTVTFDVSFSKTTWTKADGSASPTLPTPVRPYIIIKRYDPDGFYSEQYLKVDNTIRQLGVNPVNIEITSPKNNFSFLHNQDVVIPLTAVVKTEGGKIVTNPVTWKNITNPDTPVNATSAIIADVTTLPRGTYTFEVTGTDDDGNVKTANVTFTIINPTWEIDFSGLVLENRFTTQRLPITWDNALVLSTGLRLESRVTLTNAANDRTTGASIFQLLVKTVSGSGTITNNSGGFYNNREYSYRNRVTATLNGILRRSKYVTGLTFVIGTPIIPDTTLPVITITTPNNSNIEKAGSKVDIAFTATDNIDGDIKSSVTWQDITDANNPKSASPDNLQNLALGTYTYQASVTDAANNAAVKKSITFTVRDTTKPSLTITNPTNSQMIRRGRAFDLVASAVDTVDGDISDNIVWTDITDPKNPVTITSIEGIVIRAVQEYTYQASITDNAGNTRTRSVTFEITRDRDTTEPVISITTPANESTIPHGPITLAGSAIDDRDGDITRNIVWTDITDLANPVTLDSTMPITFSIGTHTIEAKITDTSNNEAVVTSTFTVIDQTGPVINITSPISQEYERSINIPLTATALDSIDGDISESIVWTDLTTGEGLTDSIKPTILGVHTIEARVIDSNGNVSAQTVDIDVIHFYEKPARRIRFIREIGGLPRTITDGEILQRIITDDFIANDLFVGRIDRNSNDQDYHNLITVSNIITAIQLMITVDYSDSDDANGRDNSVRTLTSLYQDIIAGVLQSSELQRTTIATKIKETPNEGTFD